MVRNKRYKVFLRPNNQPEALLGEYNATSKHQAIMEAFRKFRIGDVGDLYAELVKFKDKYKTCQAILNNKLETLYISHEETVGREINGGEYVETVLLICGMPNEKILPDALKKSKQPRVIVCKSTVLFD